MPVTAKKITLDEAVGQLEKKQPAIKPVTLDEAATDLLKKNVSVGGQESSKPLPGSPLEVEDQPTRFDASFLDRDIDRQFETSLSNPELFKPQNKYSLRNLFYESQKAKFDERRDLAMSEVKQDTQSLTAYNNRRISEINQDIDSDVANLKGLVKAQAYGGGGDLLDKTRILEKQIASAQLYKNKLKTAIGSEAIVKIVPEFVAKDVFDPGELGREIIRVADPETEQQYQEAEKLGSGLPPIQSANMERLGLDVANDYLQRLPQTEATKAKLADVEAHEKSFDERNPEVAEQRVREKLAVYFYNQGKSGVFGYNDRNLLKAINDSEANLSEADRKIALERLVPQESRFFLSTEISGSGFGRSFKNAIERGLEGVLNSINSGVVTSRTESERAYENLNQEIENSRFRQPGESPSLKYELLSLNSKEQSGAKLTTEEASRKNELEKLVNVRNTFSKFKDITGDLTGQVILMAGLTKGIGAVGKLATAFGESGGLLTGGMTSSAIGTALSNETVGLFLSSFLQSNDRYRMQALQLMPGDKNAANRKAYALTMSAFEGLSEGMFNDVKVLRALSKEVAPTIQDITSRFINKEITREVAGEELKSALVKYGKPFAKSFVKSEVQESSEEAVVDWADGISQSLFLGQPFDIAKTGKQSLNTFLTTALGSPLVAGMAAHGAARANVTQNSFYRAAIVDMGMNPHPYLESVEQLKLNGTIDQEQANEKIQLINSSQKYLSQIPASVTYVNKENGETRLVNRELDYPDISSYLVHRLNEGILTQELEKTTDPVMKKQLQGEIDRSVAIRQGIADGSLGVTDDIVEVTDDQKKANELGISHTTDVAPDDLVNTKYMPKPVEEKMAEENVTEAIVDVEKLFSRSLLSAKEGKEGKEREEGKELDLVDFTDPMTGETETITARVAQIRGKQRHDLLQTFIECYTKQ